MSAESLMQDLCTVSVKSQAQDATTGAPTTTWTPNASTTRCFIQQDSSSEARLAGRETGEARWVGYFPHGTAITTGDRVAWRSKTLHCDGPPIENGRKDYYRVPLSERAGGGLP